MTEIPEDVMQAAREYAAKLAAEIVRLRGGLE